MTNIQKHLHKLRDDAYRDFNSKLIPNVEKERIIGVRTEAIKAYAKELIANGLATDFISSLPHKYFEENQLHAFIISDIADFDDCIEKVNNFLPYVDNWATTDQMIPKAFKREKGKLLVYIDGWLCSSHTYTKRFGVKMLMTHFLDADFDVKYIYKVANVHSEDYYVNMMVAWYFATALAKRYEETLPFIEEARLDKWVLKKAIQKAIESRRVSDEHKMYLKQIRNRL